MDTLDRFTLAYIECALWSSTNPDKEEHCLDRDYCAADIAPETLAAMQADCLEFRKLAGEQLDDWTDEQAGHDFWLTRCGHGAGFWDRGKAAGEALTDLTKAYFPNVDLYVGDDGLIYAL